MQFLTGVFFINSIVYDVDTLINVIPLSYDCYSLHSFRFIHLIHVKLLRVVAQMWTSCHCIVSLHYLFCIKMCGSEINRSINCFSCNVHVLCFCVLQGEMSDTAVGILIVQCFARCCR